MGGLGLIFIIIGAVCGAIVGAIIGRFNVYDKLNKYNLLGERETDAVATGMKKSTRVMLVILGIIFIFTGLQLMAAFYMFRPVQVFGVVMAAFGAIGVWSGLKK